MARVQPSVRLREDVGRVRRGLADAFGRLVKAIFGVRIATTTEPTRVLYLVVALSGTANPAVQSCSPPDHSHPNGLQRSWSMRLPSSHFNTS